MNRFIYRLLGVVTVLFIFLSCSSENGEPTPPEETEEIVDTHTYVALRNDGQLFEIGGESGKVTKSNKVAGVVFNTAFNTLTSSGNTRYFYEQLFDPPKGILYVQSRDQNTSQRIPLDFPETEYGPIAGLTSLDWSETRNELVGIVKDQIEIEPGTFRLVGIHPQTFEITNYGEIGDLAGIRSSVLIGNKLFISAESNTYPSGHQLFVLNLIDSSITTLSLPDSSQALLQLSGNGQDDTLFGFVRIDGSPVIQGAIPVIYDADDQTYGIVPMDKTISIINTFGKSYYNAQRNEHVALVATQGFFALLIYERGAKRASLLQLYDYDDLSSLIGIIDVR